MAKAQDLIKIFAQKARFEPVDVQETANNVRILGRIRNDGTSTAMDNWLLMLNAILAREEAGAKWSVDISRKYFRRAGKIVFAWRLIIQGQGIEALLQEVMAAAQAAPISTRNQVNEIPLPGVRGDRNALRSGKGAGISGSVPVGPAALMNALRGGG